MSKGLSGPWTAWSTGAAVTASAADWDATGETVLSEWHASVLSAGFVYQAGQSGANAAWTSCESSWNTPNIAPPSTSTYQRTYTFNDALSATKPIVMRAVPCVPGVTTGSPTSLQRTGFVVTHFGVGSTSATAPLTDQDTVVPLVYAASAAVGAYQYDSCRFAWTGGSGYAAVMNPTLDAARPSTSRGSFLVERTTDSAGNPTGDGFAVLRLVRDGGLGASVTLTGDIDIHAYHYATNSWTYMSSQYCWVPLSGSHNPGAFMNAYALVYLCGGAWYQMRSFVGVHWGEAVWGETFQLDAGAGLRTFAATRQSILAPPTGASAGAVQLAMRWD